MARYAGKVTDEVWCFSKPEQRVQWPYNKWYNAHIKKVIRYGYVRVYWDRAINELRTLEKLKAEEHDPVTVRLDDGDRAVLGRVLKAGVETLMVFLDRISTQVEAEAFCEKAGIPPEDLIDLLGKIYRYLPFGAQMRQLVTEDDPAAAYLGQLASYKLGHSLALLDAGRTRAGRVRLVEEVGIPEDVLLDLVRRADLSRLHLMGGGMIRQAWALGYKGLAALQKATPEDYYARCVAYYDEVGKGKPFDFTAGAVASHLARMREAVAIVEE
ncbi:MAG: DUF4332 domain-containing protein [Gemmatimonadales bacterium]|nr:MAG: DUF4332 domain-containing protein [Gemmatimonadales bacterium]